MKRPQLFIDTIPLENEELASQMFLETDRYSITPTTFKSRDLKSKLDFEKAISKTKFDIEEKAKKLSFIDEEVSKINASLSKLKDVGILNEGELIGCNFQIKAPLFDLLITKQNEIKKQLDTLTQYCKSTLMIAEQKQILCYEDLYENTQGQSVTRYGINLTEELSYIAKEYNSGLEFLNPKVVLDDPSVSSGKKKGAKSNQSNKDEQVNITLHPLEVINLQSAIDYLSTKEENKTVLIDIFARDPQTGMIKWQEEAPLPETHTVVLFKNSEKQLVVIDPSNSTFSKHLSTNTKMLISDNIEILASQKELRIYEQDKKIGTGSEPHKYRDCIDIAVKIAFGLSKIEKVDQNKIEFLEVIQEVTNQEDVNKNLFFSKQDSIARIRQASSDEVRKLSEKILNNIDKQIKSAHLHNFSKLEQQILTDSIEVLKKSYTPEQYSLGLNDLFNFCHANKELLQTSIHEIETSIQGDIVHYMENL